MGRVMTGYRFPVQGDRVCDTFFSDKERWGTVVGTNRVGEDEELFIKVKFDDQKKYDEPEELEYDSSFTKENCGNGRWDDDAKVWRIEPDEDTLPADDPFVVSLNKQMEKLNRKLLQQRLGEDWNLNLLQIETLAIDNELQAKELGESHPYHNFYRYKAEDYRRAIQYKLHPMEA